MGKEIERKFLVKNNNWKQKADIISYRQGYLSSNKERIVRIRTTKNEGYLTIKGKVTGMTRIEFEYEIPFSEAKIMLDTLCEKPLIEKNRAKIEYKGMIWEVDEFLGENLGLVIAEIELSDENQQFELPEWVGKEVTGDIKYYNSSLIKNPFCNWKK